VHIRFVDLLEDVVAVVAGQPRNIGQGHLGQGRVQVKEVRPAYVVARILAKVQLVKYNLRGAQVNVR
jgi:hypothetical protein